MRGGLERIGAAPTPEIAGHLGEESVPDPVTMSSVLPPSRKLGVITRRLPGCESGGLHFHHFHPGMFLFLNFMPKMGISMSSYVLYYSISEMG